jgi:hypothetical protein
MEVGLDPRDGELEIHLTRERLRELQFIEGTRIFVRPSRIQVFAEDYSI